MRTTTPSRAGAFAKPNGRLPTLFPIVFLSAVLIGLFLWTRPNTTIKVGADEDYEFAKALLYAKGRHFYTEIWNDQPLLHTAIVGGIAKHLTSSPLALRAVTVCFAILLTASFYSLVQKVCDTATALVAASLLILSPGFVDLSSSCMVEIPALAPAVAGLAVLVVFYDQKKRWALFLSGTLFGVAFQIKLINVILFPVLGFIIWLEAAGCHLASSELELRGIRKWFRRDLLRVVLIDGAVLGGSCAIAFLALNYFLASGDYLLQLKQTWSAHFAAPRSLEYGSPRDYPFDWSILLKGWEQTIPAAIGFVVCLFSCGATPWLALPVAWLALEFVVFGIHRPWWSYYYVHNAVPLAWCAAIGIMAIARKLRQKRSAVLTIIFAVYAISASAWMAGRVYLEISTIRHSPQTYNSLVLQQIETFKPFAKTIYTDEGVYSLHSGIPMPPKLGIVSLKRFWSGDITPDAIREELWKVKPEMFLLINDTRDLAYKDLLQSQYSLVYNDGKHRLYVRKDVVKQAKW